VYIVGLRVAVRAKHETHGFYNIKKDMEKCNNIKKVTGICYISTEAMKTFDAIPLPEKYRV
jgi:hypothetical protein